MSGAATAWRGSLVDFVGAPCVAGAAALRHIEDRLLVVRDGLIECLRRYLPR